MRQENAHTSYRLVLLQHLDHGGRPARGSQEAAYRRLVDSCWAGVGGSIAGFSVNDEFVVHK